MLNYQHHRPESWFREPLLDAFEALGPSVKAASVREWLRPRLAPMLSAGDFEKVNKNSERWWHFVHWNRQRLSDEGLVHPGPRARVVSGTYVSPQGRWELTERGEQVVDARKSR